MKIRIESLYACSPHQLFTEIRKTDSFFFVTHPIIKFVPEEELPSVWKDGRYKMQMYLFGIIPMGRQDIVIEVEEASYRIRDNGSGELIAVWNHRIKVKRHGEYANYIDEVEIKAGILTLPIAFFAYFFYHYRQYRWKKWIIKNLQR